MVLEERIVRLRGSIDFQVDEGPLGAVDLHLRNLVDVGSVAGAVVNQHTLSFDPGSEVKKLEFLPLFSGKENGG